MLKIPELDSYETKKEIIDFIKKIKEDSNVDKFIIGLSGGLDSSVVVYLLEEAIGKNNILGYHLYDDVTPKEDTKHAQEIADSLKINYKEISIESIINEFLSKIKIENETKNSMIDKNKVNTSNKLNRINKLNEIDKIDKQNKLSEGNLKARIRAVILYYFANINNGLVVGTGNRSEMLVGYFTKYGDGACDIEPIGHIYKSQLQQLAKNWSIPNSIVNKPPRAGLWEGQSDEKDLGISYEVLDQLLYMIVDKKYDNKDILKNIDISIEVEEINRIRKIITKNQHKIEIPPTPKTKRSIFR